MMLKIILSSILMCCAWYATAKQPNIIVIFTDDQGYSDLSSYASENIKTPNLDKLAASGIRFTDFYVASSVCSASRAALLTGRRPIRNGVSGVFFPDNKGMDAAEITIAEMLKPAGYSSAAIGKWHLGDKPGSLPTSQGFDYYYGVPFSNDMYIGYSHQFADTVKFNQDYTIEKARQAQQIVKLAGTNRNAIQQAGIKELVPIFEGNKIVEYPADQTNSTRDFVNKAIGFIKARQKHPFFVYLAPTMPHVPLYASAEFSGKSAGGLYGDTVEEMDFHIGRLLQFLSDSGLRDNTIIVFSSDNGPWLPKKDHAGSAKPFKDGKFSNFEGGIRVPGIISWPAKIKAGQQSNQIVSTLDLLPTFASITGAALPAVKLDGYNISDYLIGQKTQLKNPLFLNYKNQIGGVRQGKWKLILKDTAYYQDNKTNSTDLLYDLSLDPSENNNLSKSMPKKVQELKALIRQYEATSM